jgi:anti-sigma B factor antagonist
MNGDPAMQAKMSETGRFEIRHCGNATIIEVTGDLDIGSAGRFEAALELALASNHQTVVVSLLQASYFDSIGLHSLLRFAERLTTTRRRFLVVASRNSTPRRVLEIVGVASSYVLFDSIDDALQSLA